MNIEKFLADNKLRKGDLADYLGVVRSNVTTYIKTGRIPEKQAEILRSNDRGWDCSALNDEAQETKEEAPKNEDSMLRSELDLLRQIVNNQSAIIARYETIMKVVLGLDEND